MSYPCPDIKSQDAIKTVMDWPHRQTDLHWIPREKQRPRRRHSASSVDEIKHFLGATWMMIATGRDLWKEMERPSFSNG